MEIESVKTWQWMLAGIVIGFLFSCILVWSGPAFDTQVRDTMEQGEFENDAFALTKFGHATEGRMGGMVLKYHKDSAGKVLPMLRDVTVHPPIAGDTQRRYWVTGRSYFVGMKPADPTKIGGPQKVFEEWRPFKYAAPIPYVPGYAIHEQKRHNLSGELAQLKTALGGQSSFPTVNAYLAGVGKLPDANFKFQYAFWEVPAAIWSLPPLAGLLMIGIAWPLTIRTLQYWGVAKPMAAPVKKMADSPPPKPARTPSTAGVKVIAPVAAKAPVPSDAKKYGGEFYPVVKQINKD